LKVALIYLFRGSETAAVAWRCSSRFSGCRGIGKGTAHPHKLQHPCQGHAFISNPLFSHTKEASMSEVNTEQTEVVPASDQATTESVTVDQAAPPASAPAKAATAKPAAKVAAEEPKKAPVKAKEEKAVKTAKAKPAAEKPAAAQRRRQRKWKASRARARRR
jgi:cell envelope opacity-associated protein A